MSGDNKDMGWNRCRVDFPDLDCNECQNMVPLLREFIYLKMEFSNLTLTEHEFLPISSVIHAFILLIMRSFTWS